VLVLLAEVLVVWRYRPSPALPLDAPPERFSAERARQTLGRVLADGSPHAVGSVANTRVRENIEHELKELGLTPERQHGAACSTFGTCAEPINVLAKIPGRQPGAPILLAAHYDSVPAGAGAGDDGAGVATLLEVARILVHEPAPRPVHLLFDDGEELGLLGAELFVQKYRELGAISAAINVEARGTSGPSLLFETRRGSARFAELAARALERPVTNSLAVAVYRRLPNDTDLTVLSRHGVAGVNLAFIGDVSHYHTPFDDLDHLDPKSLQHHGDNVLALTRALDHSEPHATSGDAVWFDVAAAAVVWWKIELNWPIYAAIFGLALLAGALAARRVALPFAGALRGLVVMPALIALAGASALMLDGGLRALGALPAPWIAHPLPTSIAIWAFAIAALLLATLAAGAKTRPSAHWAALWTWWLILGSALSSRLPEASYLALAPLAILTICLLARALGSAALDGVAVFAPAAAVLVTWLPLVQLLYDAIGFFSVTPYPIALALALSPLAPIAAAVSFRARLVAVSALLVIALFAIAAAALAPKFSRSVPQRVTFAMHYDADAKTSRWLVESAFGPVPEVVLAAADFERYPGRAYPWLGSLQDRAHAAQAKVEPLPAPVLEDVQSELSGGRRRVRARLRSARGAELLAISLPGSSQATVRIAGLLATSRTISGQRVWIWGGPTSGVPVEIELDASERSELLLIDHSYGLPAAGRFLLDARPESAVASQLGDVTVVSRRTRL
jgi:hypothetical protein